MLEVRYTEFNSPEECPVTGLCNDGGKLSGFVEVGKCCQRPSYILPSRRHSKSSSPFSLVHRRAFFRLSLGPTVLLRCSYVAKKTKLHGLSPRANRTDRATAACRRSDCRLFADRGCHVVSVTDPYGRVLDFLYRSRYFSIK
jgi:hypothetical protein